MSYLVQKRDLSTQSVVTQSTFNAVSLGLQTLEGPIRIAARTGGECRLVTWATDNLNNTSTTNNFLSVGCIYTWDGGNTTIDEDQFLGVLPAALEGSEPIHNDANNRFYVSVVSDARGFRNDELSIVRKVADAHTLVDITEPVESLKYAKPTNPGIKSSPPRWRPVAALNSNYSVSKSYSYARGETYSVFDPDLAFPVPSEWMNSRICSPRPGYMNGDMLNGTTYISSVFSTEFDLSLLELNNPSGSTFADTEFSGGMLQTFDGFWPGEMGFIETPVLQCREITSGSTSYPKSTSVTYVAVFSRKDSLGRMHFSRTSEPVTMPLSAGAQGMAIRITLPCITNKLENIFVSIYRTQGGGTQYFLQGTYPTYQTPGRSAGSRDCDYYVNNFFDNLSDAVIGAKPVMYRQPGTLNTALDRNPPLNGTHITKHNDRLFYCSGSTVYYSSFAVDGEVPWFSPAFSIDIPGGDGDITGLASVDGSLVVFKNDSVFVVDGDGPPENGGTGTEFTTPRQIRCEYGCIDPRSIVLTPQGAMYLSVRGIELIDRGFQNVFVGRKVQRLTRSRPYVGGACFDRFSGRAMWALASFTSTYGQFPHLGGSGGTVLVYDTTNNAWTTHTYDFCDDAVPGSYGDDRLTQDVCYVEGAGYLSAVFMGYDDRIYVQNSGNGKDNTLFVPAEITTGWVRGATKQDRIRITDLMYLAQPRSTSKVKIAYRDDYDESTLTTIRTFDESLTIQNPVQLEAQPNKESVESMQFVVTTEAPVGPIGTGKHLSLRALTVRLGAKTGGQKLPAAQKG